MTNIPNNTVPGPDSQRIEDETNTNSNFSNVTDNYDPNQLNPEESEDDDFNDDVAEGSNVGEPDLDEDELSRVFPNQNEAIPDPDEVDGTQDFDEEIDPDEIDIPDEGDDLDEDNI